MFFPECVARVPLSLWRCGGWAVFARRFSAVRNRPQPPATVRNRSQVSAWGRYGRAYGKSCKRGHFWSFPASHTSFRVAGVTLCDISKVVLSGRRNTFAIFSEDALHFWFVEGATLWRPPMSFCVAGAALWTCRVACFLRIALSALRAVVTRCKFRGRRGILWHVMKIDGRLALNVVFEVGS